jgi:hypothetical protein
MHRRPAVVVSVTEDLLNDLVSRSLDDGVSLSPLTQRITLPAMGEVDLGLGLRVTGGRFRLQQSDGGRARVVVTADGEVSLHTTDYEGDEIDTPPLGLPVPPGAIPVRVEALVDPYLELRGDHTVSVGLDLAGAELVSLTVDTDVPPPGGVAPEAWLPITQMTQMMFGSMGDGLFAALGEHVGAVGMDLGPDIGILLHDLGVDRGRAETRVGSGLLSFALPAHESVEGRADPVPVAGRAIGVSLARSGVDRLSRTLLERAAGGLPLPFELEVDLGEQRIGGTLRQTRLLSERFPDLRSSVRTDIRPRLVDGRLELALQAAWLQLPELVPGFVNDLSRRLGGLASLAPLRFRFPAAFEVPLVPGSDDTVAVRVDDLRVTGEGAGIVLVLDHDAPTSR